MTRQELVETINAYGIPAAYSHFDESDGDCPTAPPYICYIYGESNNFAADGHTYAAITPVTVRLYQSTPDFAQGEALHAYLEAAGLYCELALPTYDQDTDTWTTQISTWICE